MSRMGGMIEGTDDFHSLVLLLICFYFFSVCSVLSLCVLERLQAVHENPLERL